VHIVTDPTQRLELMTAAHDHGIPVVVVEKPIAVEGDDWEQQPSLVASSTTRFVVNTQLRFHPRLVDLHASVDSGGIGELRLIEASAGSSLLDQGVHLLDLAHWMAGDPPATRVTAQVAGAG